MECLKNCCKNLLRRKVKDQEIQVITLKMPPKEAEERQGVTDDYLLSKLPPDGREVPFVLPTFKASYIQPKVPEYNSAQSGLQSSARCTYAARKAELLGSNQFIYSPESSFHRGQVAEYFSPGSTRRDTLMSRTSGPHSSGWTLKQGDQQRLSSSMFDLSSPHSHKQRLDSTSSALSSTSSSMMDSIDSSLDSITLSGDERELGKVCVRLSYQEALEQVWITLVECSDLSLHVDVVEQQRIGFKAIITIPKPIQFKSTIKEYRQDVSFMETFVFALRLHQLRCSALVLRLQTHQPKKRTVAECVLSLRQLDTRETEHWLHLNPLSKSPVCHSELHLTTCFQPVNGRIQLQVLAAQNLPASSSPLTQAFFVKVEMLQLGKVVMKKKTRVLKASGGQCQWAETLHFLLASLDHAYSLVVKLYSRSSVRRKQCLGQVQLGFDSSVSGAVEQWKDTMAHPEKVVAAWHRLSSS
ncbi:tandem C2 domains nuclear protein [Salarias fasciatus]|uniref:tandem C2 domains nuclear protein n=1 Tax=Salarias fasciatus TaxID=181472 RepID=UPI001176685B|nr:tandem C2 domains nuclear protein [Salarias fasciatus]XP_029972269.1 tandem C2 domains nuclear protein [Salarias fasciatus]